MAYLGGLRNYRSTAESKDEFTDNNYQRKPCPSSLTGNCVPRGLNFGNAGAVLIRLPKPWYASRLTLVSAIREKVKQHESPRGLLFTVCLLARSHHQYGAIYFWESLEDASCYFGSDWLDRFLKETSATPFLEYFEVATSTDEINFHVKPSIAAHSVGLLIKGNSSSSFDQERLFADFHSLIGSHGCAQTSGAAYRVTAENGSPGLFCIWERESCAQEWISQFLPSDHQALEKAGILLEWFDIPVISSSSFF